eukprot:11180394-Lingulodinium_polyedra.AAC.1
MGGARASAAEIAEAFAQSIFARATDWVDQFQQGCNSGTLAAVVAAPRCTAKAGAGCWRPRGQWAQIRTAS